MTAGTLPKTIWIYWAQGEAAAPYLVQRCIESWRRDNPGWALRLLDDGVWETLPALEWLRSRNDIGLQHRADLLRLELLATHGGVWADATLFCNRPLDDWLAAWLDDDFFAFASIKRDRRINNWFLAGGPDSRLLKAWHAAVVAFWRQHRFPPQGYWRRQLTRKLLSLRKRGLVTNGVWFSDFLLRRARACPYPVNMYLFDKVVDDDPGLARLWRHRRHHSDRDCEYLQHPLGIHQPVTAASKAFLERGAAPVYKLNWRQDRGEALPGSNFEYLLRLKGGIRASAGGGAV